MLNRRLLRLLMLISSLTLIFYGGVQHGMAERLLFYIKVICSSCLLGLFK